MDNQEDVREKDPKTMGNPHNEETRSGGKVRRKKRTKEADGTAKEVDGEGAKESEDGKPEPKKQKLADKAKEVLETEADPDPSNKTGHKSSKGASKRLSKVTARRMGMRLPIRRRGPTLKDLLARNAQLEKEMAELREAIQQGGGSWQTNPSNSNRETISGGGDVERHFYDKPAIRSEFGKLRDMREWVKTVFEYASVVRQAVRNGYWIFIRGRLSGNLKGQMELLVSEAHDDNSKWPFEDTEDWFRSAFSRLMGDKSSDEIAREELSKLKFREGNLVQHLTKVEALFSDMREHPKSELDKMLDFIGSLDNPLVKDALWNRDKQIKWRKEGGWQKLKEFVRAAYANDHVHPFKVKSGKAGDPNIPPGIGVNSGLSMSDLPRRGGKGDADSRLKRVKKFKANPHKIYTKEERFAHAQKTRKEWIELSKKAREWYIQHKLCTRCAEPYNADKHKFCKKPFKIAKDLPEDLKRESLKDGPTQ